MKTLIIFYSPKCRQIVKPQFGFDGDYEELVRNITRGREYHTWVLQ